MTDKERIKELEAELAIYKESPYLNAYVGLYTTIERWNNEIKTTAFSIKSGTDEDLKTFEKAHKFCLSIKSLYEQLDSIRKLLTPEQASEGVKEATNILERALQLNGKIQ